MQFEFVPGDGRFPRLTNREFAASMRIRCQCCGRFIGSGDAGARTWTPYGTAADTEPPEAEFACGRCWDRMSDQDRRRITLTAWQGPTRLNARR